MIFVTSDTHFNHANIIEYDKLSFDSVESMNRHIIQKWNATVGQNDLVYHLGDFGMGSLEYLKELLKRLNGHVSIVKGNHDESLTKLLEIGFKGIFNEITLNYYGYILVFTHEPKIYLNSPFPVVEPPVVKKYENKEGVINIHGHTHLKDLCIKNFINVCSVACDFKPMQLDEIIKEYKNFRRKK